jgi:hypothetical protein
MILLAVFHTEFFVPDDFLATERAASIFIGHNILISVIDCWEMVQLPRHAPTIRPEFISPHEVTT